MTHTQINKLEAAFTGHASQPSGWAPCALSRDLWASADSLLELGQVLTGSLTVMPTVVWAWTPEAYATASGFATPSRSQVLIYTPESRETNVSEFLAQGNYTKAPITETRTYDQQGPGCFHSIATLQTN